MFEFIYQGLKDIISEFEENKEIRNQQYIVDIFEKTEVIMHNYLEMFSKIKMDIISEKCDINDIILYLQEREYEVKEIRVYVRSYLKDKYYVNNETRVKFVAAIYGILECYPVKNVAIVDKSNHTIHSYIKFCKSIENEEKKTQKNKILNMTEGILRDLIISWETVCECYRLLMCK